jgi:hypothetical protein
MLPDTRFPRSLASLRPVPAALSSAVVTITTGDGPTRSMVGRIARLLVLEREPSATRDERTTQLRAADRDDSRPPQGWPGRSTRSPRPAPTLAGPRFRPAQLG